MASLADIPDAFLHKDLIEQFIEWLTLTPTTPAIRAQLLSIWTQQTGGAYTADQYLQATTTGLLVNGN